MNPIWFGPITLEEINVRLRNSLSDHLGIEFIQIGDRHLSARMPVDHRTMQPMGLMHGGASCALAESVGSVAANCCVDPSLKVCVGLEINVNHIKSVRGGHVVGTARPLHIGKTTQVWDIQIHNESNILVACSRLTMAVLTKSESLK